MLHSHIRILRKAFRAKVRPTDRCGSRRIPSTVLAFVSRWLPASTSFWEGQRLSIPQIGRLHHRYEPDPTLPVCRIFSAERKRHEWGSRVRTGIGDPQSLSTTESSTRNINATTHLPQRDGPRIAMISGDEYPARTDQELQHEDTIVARDKTVI